MENATHAFYMALAVFIFVIALSITIVSLTNAKSTADTLLYTQDETNFYEYTSVTGKADENRIVGLETVIPTLYKYYKENYTVVFKEADYNTSNGTFTNVKNLTVYTTPANLDIWGSGTGSLLKYSNIMRAKYGIDLDSMSDTQKKSIFSFDLEEETFRHEPWTGSNDRIKHNLDCFLNGDIYYNPSNNKKYIEYEGFIKKATDYNWKFVETISEYNYDSNQKNANEDGSSISNLTKEKSKRMITFTKINNLY